MPRALAALLLLLLPSCVAAGGAHRLLLWPQPRELFAGPSPLPVSKDFRVLCARASPCPAPLLAAAERARAALTRDSAGVVPPGAPALRTCWLRLAVGADPSPLDGLPLAEAFALRVGPTGRCDVDSPGPRGAMHALSLLCQAVDGGVLVASPLAVADAPRFAYRGLLVDTARRFLPLSALVALLDGMAANRLNVLHWHAIDADSAPLYLPSVPGLASAAYHPRAVYTPGDVAALAEAAASRGVELVLEVDSPAHGAWGRAGVAGAASPACPDTLDPTSDAAYALLASVLRDAAALLPSAAALFLGGDEVRPLRCWSTAAMDEWRAEAGVAAPSDLVALYWRRVWAAVVPAALPPRPRRPAPALGVWRGAPGGSGGGSDEDAGPPVGDLPDSAYVVAWQRGALPAAAAAAAAAGRGGGAAGRRLRPPLRAVAAAGWYLDTVALPPTCAGGGSPGRPLLPPPYALHQTWRCHWLLDPASELDSLPPANRTALRLLGGQVSSWGEGVAAATLGGRVWDRASAAAERLWAPPLPRRQRGPGPERDAAIADAERRLGAHLCRLRIAGLQAAPIGPGFCAADLGVL